MDNQLTEKYTKDYRQTSDDLADQLVLDLYKTMSPKEVGQLFRDYINDLDELQYENMPNCLRIYFESNQALPSWKNDKKIKVVEELFLEIGHAYSACLLCCALPVGYTSKNVVKVLTSTGYLSKDSKAGTAKRLLETTQFVFNVMSENALDVNALGTKHVLKVRFIHAMIRYHLQKHGWDDLTYGIPINQEDMAATILTFSVGGIKGLDRININLTKEEKDAMVHFWALIGHLIGVDANLNPREYEEAEKLYEQILQNQAEKTTDGEMLTRALSNFIQGFLQVNVIPFFPDYLIRNLINNDEYSDMIGLKKIEKNKDKLLFKIFIKYLRFLNKYRKFSLVKRLIKPANKQLSVKMIAYFDTEFDLKLHIPIQIEKAWGLRVEG